MEVVIKSPEPINLWLHFGGCIIKKYFKKKKLEYLTEAQNTENGGPLLVDIDLKYNSDITERQQLCKYRYFTIIC